MYQNKKSTFDDNNIKVADFGFAKKVRNGNSLMTQCGTPGYVAPEIVKGIPYGTQVDMWSLGVILYILIAGYPPFNGKTQKDLFKQIRRGRYQFHEQFWGGVSDEGKDLVAHLLIVDPKKRFTASDALASDWILQELIPLNKEGLRASFLQLKKFNAKRKVKQAVLAVSIIFFLLDNLCFYCCKKFTHILLLPTYPSRHSTSLQGK